MKRLPFTALVMLITVLFFAGNIPENRSNSGFEKKWKEVETLKKKGLPKSALKIVDNIYREAKKEDNKPQLIKALIYKMSLRGTFEEEHLLKNIRLLEEELNYASEPEKSILYSLTAELYQTYYQRNRYKIMNRSYIEGGSDEAPELWDARRFVAKITGYYLKSVKNREVLEQVSLKDYLPVVVPPKPEALSTAPTLYDLLAERAIDYFSTSDASQFDFVKASLDTALLVPVREFITMKLPEETDTKYRILHLYQNMLELHLKNGDTTALVTTDLDRLNYIKEHLKQNPYTAKAYVKALQLLYETVKTGAGAQQAAYRLANFYIMEMPNYDKSIKDNMIKAETVCREAIKVDPGSQWAEALKGLIKKIHRPSLSCMLKNETPPGEPLLIFTSYKNIDTVYVKIVSYEFDIQPESYEKEQQRLNRLKKKKGVYNHTFVLPHFGDYTVHSTELDLPGLRAGQYVLFLSDDKSFSDDKTVVFKKFQVTSLSYLIKNGERTLDIYVLNRTTGKPVPAAHITVYRKEYGRRNNRVIKTGDYDTDNEGFVSLPAVGNLNSGNYLLDISKNNDRFYDYQYAWFHSGYTEEKPREKTFIFTDRAIYRPGQTVYFKAISVKSLKNNSNVIPGKEIEIQLKDANYKTVAKKTLVTNDFGSVQGSFVLPSGKLNGMFNLRCKDGSASFRVEEYKRPTFKVMLDSVDKSYRLNDVVEVRGNASDFAGSPLGGAKVTYRVTCNPVVFWGYFSYYFPYPRKSAETEITNGELITADDGSFTISFKALPDPEQEGVSNYRYRVIAEVTDITGEMQSDERVITIGKDPFVININSPEKVNRETFKGISVSAKNLSGKAVTTEARVTVFRLNPLRALPVPRPWEAPDTMIIPREQFEKDFPHLPYGKEQDETEKTELFSKIIHINGSGRYLENEIKKLSPGRYLISVESSVKEGKNVKAGREIMLFSVKSKTVPGKNILWFAADKKTAQPGETITFLTGSADKNSRIFLEIFSNNKKVKEAWIKAGRKQQRIPFEVTEENRGIVVAKATVVRFNYVFSQQQVIDIPFNNKKLNITLETNRDHLVPGKEEQWKVHISGFYGEKVAAELLAGMYDASLDMFAANRWNINLYSASRPGISWNAAGFTQSNGRYLSQPSPVSLNPPQIVYPQINWFGYPVDGGRSVLKMTEVEEFAMAPANAGIRSKTVAFDERENISVPAGKKEPPAFEGKTETGEQPPEKEETGFAYRSNFNETAFFYPQMHTDSLGNVSFDFKTPDALTEWKLMMLAHTKDMRTGTVVRKIKAQKELMVLMNKPVFVRIGDRISLTGKVVNFTNRNNRVRVTVQFFNPVDNKPLQPAGKKLRRDIVLELPARKSVAFSQEITIPRGYDLLGYRIKAVSDKFTDGVEDMIPVLPDKMLVTETMPMWIKGNSTKTFRFERLLNEDKLMRPAATERYRYTVEFTSHPVWYAVQALPYLAKPEYESNQNLFYRYYANTIAAGIVKKFPRIKSVLEAWKNSSPDAFLSNLEKNEELKGVLLDATPWVLEAESETEQKRRIALLFDINNLSNQLDETVNKLAQRQLPSGAWSWFKGMYEDRYVTQKIVSGFGRLRKMGLLEPDDNAVVNRMIKKAVAYLDGKINNDYQKLLKRKNINLKKKHIGSLQIGYLYARSAFLDIYPVKDVNKKAFDYYVSQERRYWLKQNNYLQAMTAVTLQRLNYRNDAEAILRSLTERALENEETGMYWRTESGWYWYQEPLATEVMTMEAYDEVMHDAASVEKMKIWLLKNKQTNRWKTSSTTADAIFGLLMKGNNLIEETGNARITVGGQPLNAKGQAGSGYIKKTWFRDEIKPEMGSITVENKNKTIAWGAAYYQYFEDLDKINSHQTDLTVDKKYFLRKITPQGPVIVPLTENTELHTGQTIEVRLVVAANRDMEYVHLKDMHAAAFETAEHFSGVKYRGGIGYYQNIKDASVDFFMGRLPKGVHVFEYKLKVTQKGSFSSGIATVQCLYAPEFAAHSQGRHFEVGE